MNEELSKLINTLDKTENELKTVQREKSVSDKAVFKLNNQISLFDKKYNKSKFYVKNMEKALTEKIEEIEHMKMLKKNDELCSHIE